MTLVTAVEIVVAALLVMGGIFGVIGSWGLLRLPESMQRLHAPTKASTIGVGTALIAAAMVHFLREGRIAWPEILITLLVFVTAPLSAILLSKVHLAEGRGPKDGPDAVVKGKAKAKT